MSYVTIPCYNCNKCLILMVLISVKDQLSEQLTRILPLRTQPFLARFDLTCVCPKLSAPNFHQIILCSMTNGEPAVLQLRDTVKYHTAINLNFLSIWWPWLYVKLSDAQLSTNLKLLINAGCRWVTHREAVGVYKAFEGYTYSYTSIEERLTVGRIRLRTQTHRNSTSEVMKFQSLSHWQS